MTQEQIDALRDEFDTEDMLNLSVGVDYEDVLIGKNKTDREKIDDALNHFFRGNVENFQASLDKMKETARKCNLFWGLVMLSVCVGVYELITGHITGFLATALNITIKAIIWGSAAVLVGFLSWAIYTYRGTLIWLFKEIAGALSTIKPAPVPQNRDMVDKTVFEAILRKLYDNWKENRQLEETTVDDFISKEPSKPLLLHTRDFSCTPLFIL